MKGPRLTNTQSRGMRDGTTRYATGTPCLVKEPRGHAIASSERHRLMAGDISDSATTPIIAELLFLALTILLAVVIASVLFGLIPFTAGEEETPEILKIVSISHNNDDGKLTYAGVIRLRNIGYEDIENSAHGLYLSINGERVPAVVETLSAREFIPTHHYGVRLLKGPGPTGDFWESNFIGFVDVSDEMILPGDLVTVEIYEKKTGLIISRSEMYAPNVF